MVLGRENYDWTTLVTAPGTYALSTWYHMKVVVRGNEIQVYVVDMSVPKIDYVDEAAPFTHGKVGIRAHHAVSNFDNFTVNYVAPPPPPDGGVADASVDSSVPDAAGGDDSSVPDAAAAVDSSVTDSAGGAIDSSLADGAGVPPVGDASAPVGASGASSSGSCGCRAAGGAPPAPASALAILGAAWLVARRRRRERS